ncbi:MAG: hypothetical protein OXG92_12940 [Chloroflexi bacterium]|nr:hypothetical protein [Chloroflexota bacterium]MCY3583540.1 hypothetical protein [Chloroflexota bacterium]MCY3717354.1 hypothetical protein [Chloroflexota bacterium]MDE2651862.1 hypothetical protein [Chloroflexota bacterium]MXX50787.1 class I SAM-dependent RNA methyltransferase [Chloroflexota bacterium]
MAKQGKPRRRHPKQAASQRIRLDIRAMGHGGKALGFHRGKPVFVPYAIPGEAITAETTGGSGGAIFARGLTLLAASADRIAPSCPHFGPGACWGCHWQHIDYVAQLLLKQDVLADQLSRLGHLPDKLIEAALQPVLPAAAIWRYQHSLRLSRGADGWGLAREAGGMEAIADCHLARPELIALLDQLELEYARARHMTLRRGSDGRLMLILEVDAEVDPELHTDLPLSVNLLLPSREPINLIGDAHSNYLIRGRAFRATAGSAIRNNLSGIEQLVTAAISALQLNDRQHVLDLYAGIGVFSAFMAEQAALVTTVESYPPAANDADFNLREHDNIDLIEGGVAVALSELAAAGGKVGAALVDPPSNGLGAEVIDWLARLPIKRLAYVSGDPASLARDARRLRQRGFQLQRIQPIDLSPQTYYIDCVAAFAR